MANFPIRAITDESELYPPLLREIAEPPAQLYIRGNVELLQHPKLLAVVGSRKASAYGSQCIKKLLPPVTEADVRIVSGLAFGIDAMAARICVENNVPTVAVLGTGIEDASIYPRAHLNLARHILDTGGVLVTEYPEGSVGYKSNFPARNRIIAGLCQATLIVQAAQHSGSLITARFALDANRDVCAVPGAITDPLSAGTNQLIRQGATPVLEPKDLLQLYGIDVPEINTLAMAKLSPEQQQLFALLSDTPTHIDALAATASLTAATVSVLLVELELLEVVQHTGGMKYVRRQ